MIGQVLEDGDGDWWYEIYPGRYSMVPPEQFDLSNRRYIVVLTAEEIWDQYRGYTPVENP